ncbi:MAG: hypothetical protein HUU20_04190 [Pirellulales bacterium]|nr:hypothetical protein [Pirellulales bacterium]
MSLFAIIEVDEGLTVTELSPNEPPETKAVTQGGVVVDPGPYYSFQDAYDAMLAMEDEIEEEGTT